MFLGVDGGGTKTAFVLIDSQGNILAEHEENTCYHLEVGVEGARQIIEKGMVETLSKANKSLADLSYAFFGLPAYGEDSSLNTIMDELPGNLLPKDRYQCDNDMVNGWAAAFGGGDGINIIAGTGSIAYGVKDNVAKRCGGWGELFSDEGSAYWIGCKGLNAFTRMSDGRLNKGPLYEIIKATLNIEYDLDITALILGKWQGERSKVASISSLVSKAAEQGDSEALKILREAGQELANIVDATKQALHFDDTEQIHVSFSGGVFRSKDLILKPFIDGLNQLPANYKILQPSYSPVIGAALYACKLSGQTIAQDCLDKLKIK